MILVRLMVVVTAFALSATAFAEPAKKPAPHWRPAVAKPLKLAHRKDERHAVKPRKPGIAPVALVPPQHPGARVFAPPPPVLPPTIPLAVTHAGMPSPLDLAAVKQAIDLVHKDRQDDATNIEK